MTFPNAQGSATNTMHVRPRRRQIGMLGTTARVAVGLCLAGSVVVGQWVGTFRPASWLLGFVGFPSAVLAWQWWRARRSRPRFEAIGPMAHVLNILVFLALYLTPSYAPALSVTSDAALSNWMLGREDQVGCLVFVPVDYLEQRLGGVHHDQIPGGWRC